jgi:hypothetical protein
MRSPCVVVGKTAAPGVTEGIVSGAGTENRV